MRIVVTVPWARRLGGAEAMLQTLLDGMLDNEHEFELVFFEHGPWEQELADAGFRTTVITAGRVREVHRWLATVLRLAGLFRRRQPDIIINWTAKTQLYGSPAAIMAGMTKRVIWWQHTINVGHWVDRCASVLPAHAIGCSSHAGSQAQTRYASRSRTFVVAPGTAIPSFSSDSQRPVDLPTDTLVVGIVGRVQPSKGQDRLLRAQALLRDEGNLFHTLIVGGDAYDLSPGYMRQLPALIKDLRLDDAVTMTGQVTDAGPYIESMDILVNASDTESFGLVLLEGMARHVAVVAASSGGPAELIDHGRTGILVPSNDPIALADALRPLLTSSQARQELGEAGHRRYMEDFTDSAMRERFLTALQAQIVSRAQLNVS